MNHFLDGKTWKNHFVQVVGRLFGAICYGRQLRLQLGLCVHRHGLIPWVPVDAAARSVGVEILWLKRKEHDILEGKIGWNRVDEVHHDIGTLFLGQEFGDHRVQDNLQSWFMEIHLKNKNRGSMIIWIDCFPTHRSSISRLIPLSIPQLIPNDSAVQSDSSESDSASTRALLALLEHMEPPLLVDPGEGPECNFQPSSLSWRHLGFPFWLISQWDSMETKRHGHAPISKWLCWALPGHQADTL